MRRNRDRDVAGAIGGATGPVADVVIAPEYFDITVPANSEYVHPTKRGYTVFIYAYGGEGRIVDPSNREAETPVAVEDGCLALLDDGDKLKVRAGSNGLGFLFVSGKPIGESIAWRGPIVMNTEEELEKAYDDLAKGTFVQAQ